MATSLHRVLQNYAWRMEAISPSVSGLVSGVKVNSQYREYDPLKEPEPQQSSGWSRRFYVEWVGSDGDGLATDADRREAVHQIRVSVVYPLVYEYKALQMLIAQDRHDINMTLRSRGRAYVKGYDDSHTTTSTGLYLRKRRGDVLDKRSFPGVWLYTVEFDNTIREAE